MNSKLVYHLFVNPFWIILLMCGLNLWLMHYSIMINCQMDAIIDWTAFLDNFVGVSFDVIILFFFQVIFKGNNNYSLGACFFITWIWSFTNIIYSRFFYHYLSFSAVSQSSSLFDGIVIKCIVNSFRFEDFLYICIFVFFVYLIRIPIQRNKQYLKKALTYLCVVVFIDLGGHALFCVSTPELRYVNYYIHRLNVSHFNNGMYFSQPIYANFIRGALRSIVPEVILSLQGEMDLTGEQIHAINSIIDSPRTYRADNSGLKLPKNIIFILVESYMSFTSDMKVGNNEVTPFLNTLKQDSVVYYNGSMKENVTIGESSDGQFIYMTGLLPLRSMITVSKAKRISLPGLPKILGMKSRMVIPTVASMWNQDEMCQHYGFDNLYTSKDYEGGRYESLTDEQLFDLAIQKDKGLQQPFFSVILTMSMHQPYVNQIDPTFPVDETTMSKDLACYLNACHYTDSQIKRYFDHLKQVGLYDNSLIVIAADHRVHNVQFGDVSDDIPLYIVNVMGLKKEMWKGDCNQIDVYITLLDLMRCKSKWHGLGHSLVSSDYQNSVTEQLWDVSEWIVLGDFFSRQSN